MLYTSGKLGGPNIYSCSREFVCLCAFPAACQSHFQPVPVAFSSCQLHSSCAIFTPLLNFLGPPTTMPGPETFLLYEQTPKLWQRENPQVFEPVYSATARLGEAAVLSENQSPFAELQCTPRPPPPLAFYVKLKLEQFWSFGKRKLCLVLV